MLEALVFFFVVVPDSVFGVGRQVPRRFVEPPRRNHVRRVIGATKRWNCSHDGYFFVAYPECKKSREMVG